MPILLSNGKLLTRTAVCRRGNAAYQLCVQSGHCLAAVPDVQLLQDLLNVLVDGCYRYAKPQGDLSVRATPIQLGEDLLFAPGQASKS